MFFRKHIKATIITLIISIAFLAIFYISYKNQKTITPAEQVKNSTEARDEIQDSIGGYISEDGFEITYSNSRQEFVLTVLKNPFEKYKTDAYSWLENKGLDIEKTKITCLASKGVDVTEEQLSRCDK